MTMTNLANKFGNGVEYIYLDEPLEDVTVYRKFSEDRKIVATSTISGPHKIESEPDIEKALDLLLTDFDRGEGNGN
jgi:hypothetical protein